MDAIEHQTHRRASWKHFAPDRCNMVASAEIFPSKQRQTTRRRVAWQFRLIRKARTRFLNAGWPVLSVDAKNAELIGDYKSSGKKWEHADKPELVKTHDFKTKDTIKAIPYGIYDIGRNEGHVEVGTSHNTGRFAVDAIRSWWRRKGKRLYPETTRLAIECDGGGSNGHRPWLWKRQLQKLSDDT